MNLSRSLATVTAAAVGLGVVALAAPAAASAGGSPHGSLVISQVYGGGGNTGAPIYSHDFVELLNRGTTPVSTGGLSLQYGSATGTGNIGASTAMRAALPSLEIAPGQRLLVRGASGSNTSAPALTGADADSTLQMDDVAGKVVLLTGTAGLGCFSAASCSQAQTERIVDLVGYGNATWHEGTAPAPALRVSTAAVRAGDGCTDSDDNRADFATSSTPGPRGYNAPLTPCAVGTTPATPPAEQAPEHVGVLSDEPIIELAQQLEGAGPAQTQAIIADLVDALAQQTAAENADASTDTSTDTAPANGTSAPQPGSAVAASVTRHPGCNGIEIAVTKVKAGGTAKAVLAAKHADWNCTA